MNNSELDQILKSAKEPAVPDDYWQDFPRSVIRELRRPQRADRPHSAWKTSLAWGLAISSACLIVGFVIGHWSNRTEMASNGLLQNEKVIHEMLGMFPGQVRAIVQDEHGLNLELSDNSDIANAEPIYIRVCDGKNCSAVVTFSGQEVQIAGQNVTALLDAKGGVILVGDRFLWSKEEPTRMAGRLKIEARQLGTI